jgi:hypothetical protein
MARRPVKKRKQRATPKKTNARKFNKVIRTVIAKKAMVLNPKFDLKIGSADDPFFVHPETIPDGVALQWVSDEAPSMRDQCAASGWKLVPKCERVGGLFLMWAPQQVANEQRDKNIAVARRQMQEMRDMLRMDVPTDHSHRVPLVSESFLASEPYQSIPSDTPPIDVEVKVNFRLSARLQEAAACIGIDPQVYAQRRIALYLRGELGGILLPVYAVSHTNERGPKENALELFEGGNFNIQSRI